MSRGDRQKASDVFRESHLLFVDKKPFAEVFPEIVEIEITVVRAGKGSLGRWEEQTLRYDRTTVPGEYINCANPLYYNGGFSLGDVLRGMYKRRETSGEGQEFCQGYEGSPQGRRRYGSCMTSFKDTVQLVYRQPEAR